MFHKLCQEYFSKHILYTIKDPAFVITNAGFKILPTLVLLSIQTKD